MYLLTVRHFEETVRYYHRRMAEGDEVSLSVRLEQVDWLV